MKHLFIVGAQRSGTTYLYHILNEHPEIYMSSPVRPEPKFFLNELLFTNGPNYYEQKLFSTYPKGTHYFGEKSTSYIESTVAAKRIHQFYPDARILFILRDPVDRAYSNYRFSVDHNLEELTFEQALEAEPERLASARYATSVNPYAYSKRGHYMDYIDKYLDVFSQRQLKILIFEEFTGNLENIQQLYQWLDIDSSFVPGSLVKTHNSSQLNIMANSATLRMLASSYTDSLYRLEKQLSRNIPAWSNHWQTL